MTYYSPLRRRDRMSDIAKMFRCIVCGSPLTSKESIARGYGPSHTPAQVSLAMQRKAAGIPRQLDLEGGKPKSKMRRGPKKPASVKVKSKKVIAPLQAEQDNAPAFPVTVGSMREAAQSSLASNHRALQGRFTEMGYQKKSRVRRKLNADVAALKGEGPTDAAEMREWVRALEVPSTPNSRHREIMPEGTLAIQTEFDRSPNGDKNKPNATTRLSSKMLPLLRENPKARRELDSFIGRQFFRDSDRQIRRGEFKPGDTLGDRIWIAFERLEQGTFSGPQEQFDPKRPLFTGHWTDRENWYKSLSPEDQQEFAQGVFDSLTLEQKTLLWSDSMLEAWATESTSPNSIGLQRRVAARVQGGKLPDRIKADAFGEEAEKRYGELFDVTIDAMYEGTQQWLDDIGVPQGGKVRLIRHVLSDPMSVQAGDRDSHLRHKTTPEEAEALRQFLTTKESMEALEQRSEDLRYDFIGSEQDYDGWLAEVGMPRGSGPLDFEPGTANFAMASDMVGTIMRNEAAYRDTLREYRSAVADHEAASRRLTLVQREYGDFPGYYSGEGEVELGPVNAYSTYTQRFFGNVAIVQDVPRERILSTPFTGIGATRENEVVVVGDSIEEAFVSILGGTEVAG